MSALKKKKSAVTTTKEYNELFQKLVIRCKTVEKKLVNDLETFSSHAFEIFSEIVS